MNTIRSFQDDLLELGEFAKRLESFLEVEHEYVPGSLVVSLNGRFGSGKTTFLRMWKDSIESREGQEKSRVILLNAWESDFLGDPISAIVASLEKVLGHDDPAVRAVVQAAKDVGWFAVALGGQVGTKATGIDLAAAANFTESRRQGVSATPPDDAYSAYKCRVRAMESLKTAIRKFVEKDSTRVMFLIDELDRCRPDYAIAYLEAIKHVFDVEGLTFVLSVDRGQLESVAKAIFGNGLDFNEYYRKFVHREITLPPIPEKGYKKVAETYVRTYLEKDGKRWSRLKADFVASDRVVDLIATLRSTPRQVQEVFRILGHVAATEAANERRLLRIPYSAASIAMAALKVGQSDRYHAAGHGTLTPEAAKELFGRTTWGGDWWLFLFFSGGALAVPESMTDIAFADQIGLYPGLEGEVREGAIRRDRFEWDREDKPIQYLYTLIEQVGAFR